MVKVLSVGLLLFAIAADAATHARFTYSGLEISALVTSPDLPSDRTVPIRVTVQNKASKTIQIDKVAFNFPYASDYYSGRMLNISLMSNVTIDEEIHLISPGPGTHLIILSVAIKGERTPFVRNVGQIHVTEARAPWERIPLVLVSLITLIVTSGVYWLIARFNATATRRQKEVEAVTHLIESQGHDYYFTLVNAAREIKRAITQREQEQNEAIKKILELRAAFFAGFFLYKDNEFAFSKGLLYLKHLWAEELVLKIVTSIKQYIAKDSAAEMIIHKCFSDIAAHRKGGEPPPGALFKARNLYDFCLLMERSEHDIHTLNLKSALDPFRSGLSVPEVRTALVLRIRALRAIVTFEFTDLYEGWYRFGIGDLIHHPIEYVKTVTYNRWTGRSRRPPRWKPAFFGDGSEELASWDQVLKCYMEIQAEGGEKQKST